VKAVIKDKRCDACGLPLGRDVVARWTNGVLKQWHLHCPEPKAPRDA
jgi:hypothetical protein